MGKINIKDNMPDDEIRILGSRNRDISKLEQEKLEAQLRSINYTFNDEEDAPERENNEDNESIICGCSCPTSVPEEQKPTTGKSKNIAEFSCDNGISWGYLFLIVAIIAVIIAIIIWCFTGNANNSGETTGEAQENLYYCDINNNPTLVKKRYITIKDNASKESEIPYISVKDTTVNDIPMRIFTPKNCEITMQMGELSNKDNSIILAVQAADIRGDVDKPAGSFIYKGEVISKGHSKYGFFTLINGVVIMGNDLETPLFERAVENKGCFFRQYSLVSGGKIKEIKQRGKAIRRALCAVDNTLQVITTVDRESFHDFSQALADIGITEALSLVGGKGIMKYRQNDTLVHIGERFFPHNIKAENYLVWRKTAK